MKIKSTFYLAIAGLLVAQLFSACNSVEITKRRYNKGFYVDLGSDTKSTPVEKKAPVAVVTPAVTNTVASVETTPVTADIREQLNTLTASTKNIIARKAIRKLSREVEALASVSANADNNASVTTESAVKKDIKKEKKTAEGGKSQVVALILVILLGGLGIHRFYLGYTWQGVVQLLTLGGCGIWSLIDLVRIITGDLQPKDGRYDKTL